MYSEVSIPPVEQRTTEAQAELGRAARRDLPRSAARDCTITDRDPIALLEQQDATRLADLVPLRYARMNVDSFRFYRGTALLMAHDLEHQPTTGVELISCGDAHLSNFGFYASPERNLVFDLNDFDESAPAPWEWDVKRLATSCVLAARQSGVDRKETEAIARDVVATYRQVLRRLSQTSLLDRYYLSVRDDTLTARLSKENQALLARVTKKARKRTSAQAARKLLIEDADGTLRFREDPPVLAHIGDDLRASVEHLYRDYLETTRPDIALLLSNCRIIDVARRVVGVGSVGTRCYVLALLDPSGAPLILQVKEAPASVLLQHRPHHVLPRRRLLSPRIPEGRRVVTCQQILQSVSDPFLGWLTAQGRDFYVRQFRDMKGSFDVDTLDVSLLPRYARACATILARGHSQSPACAWIAGYLGKSTSFDRAVAAWSLDYADQAERDFEALHEAIASGRVPVTELV